MAVDSEESAIAYGGRFMQFYRENAKWRERTYDFRVGIERVRAVIVEDCEGLGAALDAAMQASVAAAYDPWKEATAPKTVNQFTSIIAAAEA
jgi:nitrite reductase [NAD(P)H] large subunit